MGFLGSSMRQVEHEKTKSAANDSPWYKARMDSASTQPSGDIEHSIQRLEQLAALDDNEQIIDAAYKILADDPNHPTAHYYLVFAYCSMDKNAEASKHLKALQELAPDDDSTLDAQIMVAVSTNRWGKLAKLAKKGMGRDPERAFYPHYLAVAEGSRGRLKPARKAIALARELDPDDTDIVHLDIQLRRLDAGDSSAAAVEQLDSLKEALQLDPEDASLHHSIGEVYREDLHDPKSAIEHFRTALRLNPHEARYQRDLFETVGEKSILYRLFSMPRRAYRWVGNVLRGIAMQPGSLLFLLFFIKPACVFLGWLLLATLIMMPGCKAYELLLVSELRKGGRTSTGKMRLWSRIQDTPLLLRFFGFLLVNLGAWIALFVALKIPLGTGLAAIGGFLGIHLLFVVVFMGVRRLTVYSARKKATRRKKKQQANGKKAIPEP